MQKYIVEALSTVSMADAAAQAMVKASIYLSENHDVRIAVLEMAAVRGKGYKVVLEVTLIPLSRSETANSDSQNPEEAKVVMAAKDRERRAATDSGIKRRIVEHFRRRKGAYVDTPSIHLAQLTEGMLLGQIDMEFMASAQPVAGGSAAVAPAAQKVVPPAKPPEEAFQNATGGAAAEERAGVLPERKTGPQADPE